MILQLMYLRKSATLAVITSVAGLFISYLVSAFLFRYQYNLDVSLRILLWVGLILYILFNCYGFIYNTLSLFRPIFLSIDKNRVLCARKLIGRSIVKLPAGTLVELTKGELKLDFTAVDLVEVPVLKKRFYTPKKFEGATIGDKLLLQ